MNTLKRVVKNEPIFRTYDNLRPVNTVKSYSMDTGSGMVALTDALILMSTGLGIYSFHIGLDSQSYWVFALGIIVASMVIVAVFHQAGLYRFSSLFNPLDQVKKIVGIMAISFMVFLAIAFSLKVSYQFSRVWFFSWFLIALSLVWMNRRLYYFLFLRWARTGKLSQRIVLVGCGEQGRNLLHSLKLNKNPWIHVLGFFDDRKRGVESSFFDIPVLGTLDDLMDYCRRNKVDDIVITLPLNANKRLLNILRKLEELPVNVCLGLDLAWYMGFRQSFSSIGGVPMLDFISKPLEGWKHFVKGLEDKCLGLLFLIILSPLMLAIALVLKLENQGPVFFRQKRLGFNNEPFMVYKFRTMFHNRPPDIGSAQARQNDSRITPFGKFMRQTSLDELPQLLNVLGGTMSLVGPRPHPIALDNEFSPIIRGYFARNRVKPGITGWAQVNGLRGETETPQKMQARVEHDVHYIENWSLLFDVRILIQTLFVGIINENAY